MPLDRSDGAYQGETFWCQVWINAHGKPHIAEAFLYNQGRAKEKYLSAQWSCVVDISPDKFSALGVSLVVNNSCNEPTNLLSIHTIRKTDRYSKRFTICLGGAIKREYSNYHQLVEWVEVNRIFGADLTKSKQDKYVNSFPKRSKFIARSDVVDTAVIHNIKQVWAVKNRDLFVCEVELPYGRLHHYRDPRWKDIEPIKNAFMHKFAEEIINRTSKVHRDVIWLQDLQ
ncbi:hypothetical protein LSH36_164g00040 [Paralvinella palmiformis]|uniref:Uncharacterized protein n=1 Tax=Paralvinella palmiformis TaxID=53620 RepID=A0AAD9JUN8_9ANNE|nr:hypothetical protein LSH36_164g00040 [Paralvinella palmiformis]